MPCTTPFNCDGFTGRAVLIARLTTYVGGVVRVERRNDGVGEALRGRHGARDATTQGNKVQQSPGLNVANVDA